MRDTIYSHTECRNTVLSADGRAAEVAVGGGVNFRHPGHRFVISSWSLKQPQAFSKRRNAAEVGDTDLSSWK